MAQIPFDTSNLVPAMASSLASILTDNIKVSEIGLLVNGTSLLAPFYDNRKVVVDLTPGEDDWLDILGANQTAMPHHEGELTQALHMVVLLNEADATKLDAIERKVQKCIDYKVTPSGKPRYGMHRGSGKVPLNIVLEEFTNLTPLRFLQGGICKKGFGKQFLDNCLNGACIKDFLCKVKVELECIHETEDAFNILLTVHSVIFAPIPKRCLVDFTPEEEAIAIRAAKRFKYQF